MHGIAAITGNMHRSLRYFVLLEHITSLFICIYVGRTYVIKARGGGGGGGGDFFLQKTRLFRLDPVYSENTALSKPYFILKAPKCEKISAKTLAFQETKS